jgi:hypothetical protein
MHVLPPEDVQHLTRSQMRHPKQFKAIIPLATLRSECGDGNLPMFFDDMLDCALRYVESVCRMERFVLTDGVGFDEHGTRQGLETLRSSVHDSFITHVNVLGRTMSKLGKNVAWWNELGDHKLHRVRFAKFAMSLSFEYVMELTRKEGGGA